MPASALPFLQRTVGNAAVTRLLLQRCGSTPPSACGCHDDHGQAPEPGRAHGRGLVVQRLTDAEKLVNLTNPPFAADARLEQAFDNDPAMRQGETGDPVKKVQRGLMDDGFLLSKSTVASGPDGDFGSETKAKVKAFQAKHGLDVDGKVGRQTLGKLDELQGARGGGGAPPPGTGFEIRGKSPSAASSPTKIFFVENSDALDAAEEAKVTALASPAGRDLTLKGFTSEDEAGPGALAAARIAAVDTKLSAEGHTGARTPDPLPGAGAGQIDYRSMRAVEVVPAGAVPSTPDCSAGFTVPCGPDPNPFTTGQAQALTMLDAAIAALATPLTPETTTLLTRLFGGPAQRATVRAKLGLLRAHVVAMLDPARHRCSNACDASCSGAIAYNEGTGGSSRMTLCPIFLNEPDLDERAGTLVHEGAHGTGGLAADDKCYGFERMIDFLKPSEALKNADSFHLFVRNAFAPGSVDIGPDTPDTFSGDPMTPAEQTAARRALAFVSNWTIAADSETSSLYATIHESKTHAPPTWTNGYYEETMGFVARRFGFTAPPALPTETEKQQVAGINDRMRTMGEAAAAPMELSKTGAAGLESWEAGPGSKATLTPRFFGLSRREQADLLLITLIQATPEILPAHQPSYAALVEDIRGHLGQPVP
jgi:peptidoglycan hydrolase-like protein with peptidoglycan-binding domain